jgi:hypothetical protein
MDAKDRLRVLQRMVHVPQADICNLQVSESGSGPQMTLEAEVKSNSYATRTGQRLFVPVCPVHQGYSVPAATANRTEDIWFNSGYLDEDDITLTIPDGYSIEASPKDVILEQPFATFSFTLKLKGNTLHIKNRLLRKSGRYDKSLYPQLQEFYRTISKTYNQKIVLKKNAS